MTVVEEFEFEHFGKFGNLNPMSKDTCNKYGYIENNNFILTILFDSHEQVTSKN